MSVHSLLEPREWASNIGAHEQPESATTLGAAHRHQNDAEEDPRALHVRTQLLRRVAHDIASPAGVTTTALEELANENHQRPELVAMARRGLRRLLRLSELLAIAADLETGPFAPDTTLEDVKRLVSGALDKAVGIDGRRDVETSSSFAEGRLVVEVDSKLLASVLREIIGNALRLATSRVVVDVTGEDGLALIRVSDDGPGFSTEALSHLGERFVGRAPLRGLGLSLSIATEVLAAHGGSLRVEQSTLPPGRRGVPGAAVVVALPLSAPPATASQPG
jgi:signal transduction histidine kinase